MQWEGGTYILNIFSISIYWTSSPLERVRVSLEESGDVALWLGVEEWLLGSAAVTMNVLTLCACVCVYMCTYVCVCASTFHYYGSQYS